MPLSGLLTISSTLVDGVRVSCCIQLAAFPAPLQVLGLDAFHTSNRFYYTAGSMPRQQDLVSGMWYLVVTTTSLEQGVRGARC